ncbi:MaoC family dehydratase [Methylobrevis pamukkalensis]|uniref:Bifunctional aldehyde dehydrogenase/enoyl-CoA hydratase n=1 Tax=Methylobrevis pamukkalensis TaxID=1439726 RepID=A0A1E3H7U4_9HYPH|nr:MaoC family dehydratase [Methylobrevis pamukkalensis]ODN71571.1 bifunctional aldehyde dehydrogenase/enoyl-CoA hydratase [Methylobrevis pamukkalensis]
MRLEDIEIGKIADIGSHLFSAEEIVRFARAFDPQPFHLDDRAAAATHFGALCASGWHTCAVWMRLTVDYSRTYGTLAGISPGMKAIRWLRPVHAGDTIRYFNEVRAKRRLRSRPGWGIIDTLARAENQHGETVLEMEGSVLVPAPSTGDGKDNGTER